MKKTVKVTNLGKRMRDRLGLRFFPKKSNIVEVNNRELLTLKAVKDFEVEFLDNNNVDIDNENIDTDNDNNNVDDLKGEKNDDSGTLEDYDDLTIEQVLKSIEQGNFKPEEAFALEVVGKNRVTLVERLEELIESGD